MSGYFSKAFISFWLATLLSGVTSCGAASAEVVGDSTQGYQNELAEDALRNEKGTVEPSPAGKIVEDIRVVTYDVIDHRDPWPRWARTVHVKTKDEVVRRELLFTRGERWDALRVGETERNLRANLFVSMATIVPMRGSAPDRVVALVVTKDIWSLRANVDFTLVDSTFQYLALQFTEQNIGGWNRKVSVDAAHDLWTNSLGAAFADPRLGGSRIALSTGASIFYGLSDGRPEGGAASLRLEQPLFRLSSEWGWLVSADLRRSIYRLPYGTGIYPFTAPSTGESVPYSYLQRTASASASVTRSYGSTLKQNISGGWRAILQHYELPPNSPTLQAASYADFTASALPRSEEAGALFVSYHLYRPEYYAAMDLDTFAFTEDQRVGPDLSSELRLANPAFGFSSRYFQASASAAWTWRTGLPIGDGDDFLTASVGGVIRNQPGVFADSDWIDRSVTLGLRNFSPRVGFFRVITALRATRRVLDAFHTIESLGGDNALRGYPVGFFTGANSVGGNAEIRTQPLRLASIHIGGVAFFDAGEAFDDPSRFSLYTSVGAGLRLVFPEFTREALRLDVGVPLQGAPGVSPVSFVLRFGQAF